MSRRLASSFLVLFVAAAMSLSFAGTASASAPSKDPKPRPGAGAVSPDVNHQFKRHGTQECPHPLKYPPLPCSLFLSRTSGPPKTKVTIIGHGYTPNCSVTIYFGAVQLKVLPTGGRGAFRGKISIPSDATPGKHVISAADNCSDFELGVTFTVTQPSSTSSSKKGFSGALAAAGNNNAVTWPIAGLGAAFVLSGARLMVMGRRRRNAA